MPARERRQLMLALALYGVLWALLASPWLVGHVTIPYDAKAHFQAQLQFLANALKSGQSPFWAPHIFAGTPQIADPQSLIFSPAFLLAYFDLTSFRAVDTYVLAILGLAGIAVILLFRDRGWHPAGGVLAAIAFSFGASAAWRIQHLGQVQSYALFGLTLFLLQRAMMRQSSLWGGGAGAAAGLMLVEPNQVALLACYVLLAIVVDRWLADRGFWRSVRGSLPCLTAAGLTAIIIAAFPLLMTYLFVAGSSRPEIALAEATRGSLHPASLLTLVVSDLFGALDPKVDYWGPFSETWDPSELTLSQNMSQLYIGALPALLVLVVGIRRGHLWAREARALTLIAVLLAMYAIGRHTPIFGAFYDLVPGVDMFRRPADATFMIGAVLALLSGFVLHRHLSEPKPVRSIALSTLGALGVALSLALGIAFSCGKLDMAWQPVMAAAMWVSASLIVLEVAPAIGEHAAGLVVVAPSLLLAADLAVNNGPNDSTALPVAQYDVLRPDAVNPTIDLLKSRLAQPAGSPRRDRVELTGLGFEWPNASLVHGIDHVLGYNPLRLDVISRGVGAGDTVAGPDQRQFTPLFPSYRCKLADLLGLRYIATSVPIEKIDATLPPGAMPLIARTKDAFIYENETALPRAMLVRDWQLADFDAILRTGAWPADPAATVLLEAMPQGSPRITLASLKSRSGNARDQVRIERYQNTVVEIMSESPSPGFLVLNDVWHPWWTAEIDGQEAAILKANVMFRAVEVPAGRHLVRFEFRPFSKAIEHIVQRPSPPAFLISLMPDNAMATAP